MSRLSADHCEHCRAEQNQQFQETSRGADSVELETFFERCELQFGIFSASSPGCSTGFDSADLILGGPKFLSECSILETEFAASRMQHRNNFVCGRSILFQGFRHVCIPAGIWFWAHPNNGINLTIPAQRHNISFLTAHDSPFKNTFTIELANGHYGYLPTPEQHLLGGYETWRARSSYLAVNSEPKVRKTILELLDSVSE